MASLGRPLASPLLWSISTFSHEIYHRGFVSRVGSIWQWYAFCLLFCPVWSTIFDRRYTSRSSNPAGSGKRLRGWGGGGGDGGSRGAHPSEVGPRLSQLVFLDVRRVSSHGRKTDPGVLLLFWGDFGGRAPTAVGDQSYLGPVYGEYLGYPSDPYRPHTFEQSPPSEFRTGLCLFGSFRVSGGRFFRWRWQFSGGSFPAWLTRRLALSYSNIWGIFTALRLIFSGSRCKVLTGQAPSWEGGLRLRIQGSLLMHPVAVQA